MEEKEIKQSVNNVEITGLLVKNSLETKASDDGKEFISGSLIIRTDDGSEHQVDYYASKLTQEGKASKLFDGLVTIMEEAISLEKAETLEEVDVIRVGGAEFSVNDFKTREGTVATALKISAKFANRLSEQEKSVTPKVATFEIGGIVDKISDEMYKNEPTGNKTIQLNAIGYKGKIIPVRLTIQADMVEAFDKVGFYEGGAGKFNGKLINTAETQQIVEKQTFGEDLVKTVTYTKKLNEVTGGSPLAEIGITEEQYMACLSKRRLHLDEVLTKTKSNDGGSAFTKTETASTPQTNKPNPFQKR